jgi:signal transduction histidine kinase/ligand-binding sensor domain-containing protein
MHVRIICLSIAALAVGWSALARALNPEEGLSEYKHLVWRSGDQGLVGQGNSVAQSGDGYLWVGTTAGLFRFDGVRFTEWKPADGASIALPHVFRASDGSLWVSSSTDRTLTRVKDRKAETIEPPDPGVRVSHLTEDEKGSIWYTRYSRQSGTGELCSWGRGVGTRCLPSKYRLGQSLGAICAFGDAIWIGTDVGLIRFQDGQFTDLSIPGLSSYSNQEGVSDLLPDGRSGLLVGLSSGGGLQRMRDNTLTPLDFRGLDTSRLDVLSLFRDREGALWIGTEHDGIYRIYHDRVDHYAATADSARKIIQFSEDQEGSIWFASADGLERFSDRRVVTVVSEDNFRSPEVDGVSLAHDGTLWVAGIDTLLTLTPGSHTFSAPAMIPRKALTTSIIEDHAGVKWIGINNTLNRLEGHRFIPLKFSTGAPLGMIASLAEDRAFNLWAVSLGPPRQILKVDPDRLHVTPIPNLPPASRVAADPAGGIYVAALNGDLIHVDALGGQVVYPHPAPRAARIPQISVTGDGTLYAATSFGLETLRSGKINVLDTRSGLPCNVLYDSIFDRYENLWLYAQCGAVRIAKEDLSRWLRDPAAIIPMELLDAEDGASPLDPPFGGSARTPDGVLWFANEVNLQKIDPDFAARHGDAPPVHLEQFTAGGKHYDTDGPIKLPPLTGDIQIDYTGLSFVAPDKMHFRYRLEGFDRDWTDAGPRRQALYTRMPPGNYRFHVIASNNDGVWNNVGASLKFELLPAFYQTLWFRSLCVILVLTTLAGLYQLRLRQLARQYNLRLEERVGERTRIARELHDTLLQSFQGLLLRFQTAYALFDTRPADAKEVLGSSIDQTGQAITEGREAVQGLRASTLERNDLAKAITTLGVEVRAETNGNAAVGLQVDVEGTLRTLHPIVRDEVYRIASEALRNAFRYAEAKQVEVELRYDGRQFRLRVRDDGKGIDPNFLAPEGRAGHFGLHGMRERAKLVGGKLTVWTAPQSGTEIELKIPASHAYADSGRSWFAEKLSGKDSETKS